MCSIKTKKKSFAGVLLAGVLSMLCLGGCGYTMVPNEYLLQTNENQELDQEEDETVLSGGEKLRSQLIAMLNLNRDTEEYVFVSNALDEAVAFCLEVVLQDPQTHITTTQQGTQSMKSTLGEYVYLYVYDGTLSYGKVAGQALSDIQRDENTVFTERYRKITSVSVAYGEGTQGAIWVILTQYADDGEKAGNPTSP